MKIVVVGIDYDFSGYKVILLTEKSKVVFKEVKAKAKMLVKEKKMFVKV